MCVLAVVIALKNGPLHTLGAKTVIFKRFKALPSYPLWIFLPVKYAMSISHCGCVKALIIEKLSRLLQENKIFENAQWKIVSLLFYLISFVFCCVNSSWIFILHRGTDIISSTFVESCVNFQALFNIWITKHFISKQILMNVLSFISSDIKKQILFSNPDFFTNSFCNSCSRVWLLFFIVFIKTRHLAS